MTGSKFDFGYVLVLDHATESQAMYEEVTKCC